MDFINDIGPGCWMRINEKCVDVARVYRVHEGGWKMQTFDDPLECVRAARKAFGKE